VNSSRAAHICRGCLIVIVVVAFGLDVVVPVWASAPASLALQSPFPTDFTGNPLVPALSDRSVSYLLSNDGYTAPLSVRRAGTLKVTWIALGTRTPQTLATGHDNYAAAGTHEFQMRLTRDGRTALAGTPKLNFWVAGSYARAGKDGSWLCLYQVTENPAHKLVFSNACGP
jgi:hypothetical protein